MARRPSASAKREAVRVERTHGAADVARALSAHVRTGSLKAAERETGIAWETIRDWTKSPKWAELRDEIRRAHAAEIQSLWTSAARDAAEGLQEAVLRCRQGLRKPALSERDAALIGRTLAGVLAVTHRLREPEEERPQQKFIVQMFRGVGVTDAGESEIPEDE